MKTFIKEALEFAIKKAKSDQQVKEIKINFRDIYKSIVKLNKDDKRTKTLS
jgi:hypothetical protein